MKYLTQVTETWRFSTESEAQAYIKECSADPRYEVKKSSCEKKQIKVKGEIVDEYVKCAITKNFADEKDPDIDTTITYEIAQSFIRPYSGEDEE